MAGAALRQGTTGFEVRIDAGNSGVLIVRTPEGRNKAKPVLKLQFEEQR